MKLWAIFTGSLWLAQAGFTQGKIEASHCEELKGIDRLFVSCKMKASTICSAKLWFCFYVEKLCTHW